jgi:hypothetical protein
MQNKTWLEAQYSVKKSALQLAFLELPSKSQFKQGGKITSNLFRFEDRFAAKKESGARRLHFGQFNRVLEVHVDDLVADVEGVVQAIHNWLCENCVVVDAQTGLVFIFFRILLLRYTRIGLS